MSENKDKNPIYYKSAEEMDKPISELLQGLRSEITTIRGKLFDIRRSYGYADWTEHLEGGLTCMISAMYNTVEQFEKHEKKHKK